MFFGRDRSFALAADLRPCTFCEDGPREPTEVEWQVVKPSQIVSDTVPVGVNNGEQIFAGRLHERLIADGMVRFAPKTSRTAGLRGRNSMRCHFVHHCLPGSFRHFWIVSGEVGASEIEVQGWLAMRFVHRIEQAFSFTSVS